MDLLMLLIVLAVAGAAAALVAGVLPGGMPAPADSVPPVMLPDRPVRPEDLHALRFVPALRGYRMEQVDRVLDHLAAEVARLRELVPPAALAQYDGVAPPVRWPIPEHLATEPPTWTVAEPVVTEPAPQPAPEPAPAPDPGPQPVPVVSAPADPPAARPDENDESLRMPGPWEPPGGTGGAR